MAPAGRRRAATLLCALVLIIGACDDDEGEPAAGASSSPPPVDEIEGAPSPTTGPIFEPGDDVLRVAVTEPTTLDPMRIGDPGSVLVARQLYESLTGWNAIDEEVFPAAAESWEVLDGGRRFRFHLRPGTTFHDGSPVTAEDFVFAFDRIAQKENGSALAYTLERVQGFDAVNHLGDSDHLTGLKAIDELTLQIHLAEPNADLPALLTHPGLVPLPQSSVKELETFLRQPAGNGPFEMARPWDPGQPIVMRRFAGFVRTPPLDGIRFTPFPDAASSWLDFVAGDFDVAEVPADQIEAAAEVYGEEGYQPLLAGYYFGFNLESSSVGDKTLRKAINLAIDRNFIAETIYRSTMDPPRGIVPVGMPGFQFNVCAELCEYRPDDAERLVSRMRRGKRHVTLEYTRGEPHRRVARAVGANLEAVGLRVKIRSFPFNEYLKRLRNGDQQMYRLGWIGEYPVPEAFLSTLFGSQSPDNHSGFSSSKVDRLLRQARAEPSPGKRQQLFVKAEQMIMKQVPIAPIGTFITHWAAQAHVEGMRFDVMGAFDAFDVSLSEEASPEDAG